MESPEAFYNFSNESYYYMEAMPSNASLIRELQEHIKSLFILDKDRATFRYIYHIFAVCIVILNVLLVIAIYVSKKQRHNYRNWLILHMTIIHILYGGIVCPFIAEGLIKRNADLDMVACKLLSFVADILDYMSNVTVGILGVYQCLNVMSPRMLKGVSRALLASMMIVMPWFICTMLTSVLRITMSEEFLGDCYHINDDTAQNLWLVVAYGMPLCLILLCFVILVCGKCSQTITTESTQTNRKSMTNFVTVCLACFLFLRPVYYFGFSDAFEGRCAKDHGTILCNRLSNSFDLLRLSTLVIIPLTFLIPSEICRGYQKVRSKMSCKAIDCSSHSKQSMRMVKINTADKSTV